MAKFTEREMAKVIAGFTLLIVLPLAGMLWADMKTVLANKVDKEKVEELCAVIKGKVDNEVLLKTLERLEMQDANAQKQLQRQEKVQDKTLEVLQELSTQVGILNDRQEHYDH